MRQIRVTKPQLVVAGVVSILAIGGVFYARYIRKKKDVSAANFLVKVKKLVDIENASLTTTLFDPTTIDTSKSAPLLSKEKAKELAEQIWDAWGIFWGIGNDDEEQILSALKQLKSVNQLKQVSLEYAILSDKILLEIDLEARQSDSEWAKNLKIINALPDN